MGIQMATAEGGDGPRNPRGGGGVGFHDMLDDRQTQEAANPKTIFPTRGNLQKPLLNTNPQKRQKLREENNNQSGNNKEKG